MRCLYHFFVGLTLSVCWLFFAAPSGFCTGPANTAEYWVGVFIIIALLASRSARYTQIKLRGIVPPQERQLMAWGLVCGPYLCELPSYLLFAVLLGSDSDTLTVLHSLAAPGLMYLVELCLILTLPCATILGWKLADSRVPAHLAVLTTGSLCIASIPRMFRINRELMRGTFPLLPVLLVAILLLSFLLLCCRSPRAWFTQIRKPHPALGLACVLPASPLLLSLFYFFGGTRLGLTAITFATLLMLFACSPLYLLVHFLPIRPESSSLIVWSFVLGLRSALLSKDWVSRCFLGKKHPIECIPIHD